MSATPFPQTSALHDRLRDFCAVGQEKGSTAYVEVGLAHREMTVEVLRVWDDFLEGNLVEFDEDTNGFVRQTDEGVDLSRITVRISHISTIQCVLDRDGQFSSWAF